VFNHKVVIVPIQDNNGKIWSYQRIWPDGSKRMLTGGRVKGCSHLITRGDIRPDDLVVVCEGFSTGASIHQATGLPVACAMMANNLPAVCDALPFTNLIVAADNDENKTGEEWARKTGRRYVMPDVVGWDFSDLYLADKDLEPYFEQNEEEEMLDAHGLVGEIANWISNTAIRPQPLLSLAAAIAFMGHVKGHRYCTNTNLRTNILALSRAPTASGKEHPQQCVFKLMTACGLEHHLMGRPVSGAGLVTGFAECEGTGMLVLDEIGRFIANAVGSGAGGFQREIIDYIVESFTKANSLLVGRQYGDSKKNPRVDIVNPNLCVLGSTVRERIADACSGRDVIDGFLNRWLLFEVQKRRPMPSDSKFAPPPQELVDKIKRVLKVKREYNIDKSAKVEIVPYTPEALELKQKYDTEVAKRVEVLSYPMDALYSRCPEHVAKMALIFSDNVCITCQDVRLAMRIMAHSLKATKRFVGSIADNQMEQDFNKVREIVAHNKISSKTELTKRTQFILGGARRREEIIEALLDMEFMVVMPKDESVRGRKSIVYKIV
jgi:hypothetical protein